jgi:hypothetical protein
VSALPPMELRNATLTAVHAVDVIDPYDGSGTGGTAKWAGSERVFWSEAAVRVTAGQESDVLVQRSMVTEAGLGIPWATGDRVSVQRDGYASQSAVVRRVVTTSAVPVGGVTRLVMEDA